MLLLAFCSSSARAQQSVAEPDGYWTGPMQGAVPATITGGTVIKTDELVTLIKEQMPVLIDVGPLPHKPENLAASAWTPPPHRSIPFSIWLPGVGNGEIARRVDEWYRAWLKSLTDGDLSKPIVIFCHPNCWGSWNAAKRAIHYGYTAVHWYEEGVEGWQDAGHDTDVVEAEKPSS